MKRTLLPLLLFLMVVPLAATTVRRVNLFEMVELADRVFAGRCLSAHPMIDPATGYPIVEYTFLVREGLKGVADGQRVVFRQIAGGEGKARGIHGVPRYHEGQELLLFLHGDSAIGLTSPVGLAQGSFRLEKSETGEVHALNSMRNRNLTYNLSRDEIVASGLSAAEVEDMRAPQPLPLSRMREVVDKISRYQSKGTLHTK
jgi:hypothetical protein